MEKYDYRTIKKKKRKKNEKECRSNRQGLEKKSR